MEAMNDDLVRRRKARGRTIAVRFGIGVLLGTLVLVGAALLHH